MTRYQFPDGFFWGAAASGPQTEGVEGKPSLHLGQLVC
jgi:6-phospho-beta-glucosidase